MRSFLAVALLTSMPVMAGEPFLVAHRGASADAPENTIPAFQLAWEQGADAIEGDFHLTADGHIVCIHDEDTQKVAGKKLIVPESTLADLRKLDVGAWNIVAMILMAWVFGWLLGTGLPPTATYIVGDYRYTSFKDALAEAKRRGAVA